jgi:hypothetical protein
LYQNFLLVSDFKQNIVLKLIKFKRVIRETFITVNPEYKLIIWVYWQVFNVGFYGGVVDGY